MMIEVVVLLVEVFVKCEPRFTGYIMAMCIKSHIRRGLRFPYILIFAAFEAKPQIYAVFASAIEFVPYFEDFPGLVALEGLRVSNLATAFILVRRQAW